MTELFKNTSIFQKDNSNLPFLCFGGLDWWYQHRSHIDFQLTRRFTKYGTTLYVNSIVMQKPNLGEGRKFFQKLLRKTKSILTGLKMTDAGFWVYSPFSMPLHHIPWAKAVNEILLTQQIAFVTRKIGIHEPLIMVVCPAACNIALQMKRKGIIYLRTDAYELFPNVDSEIVKNYDLTLKINADITLFVSQKLYSEEASQCKKALFLDHGVDYKMFESVDSRLNKPVDISNIKKPIIGFFGTIDAHTVDICLIEKVADMLPDLSFVFVGKIASKYPALTSKNNIWMLGQKPYEEIPFYGDCFDVAIMPWQQTQWIQACNPIKLKEYLALGKPIVSTPFKELQKYRDVVYVGKTAEEFSQAIMMALAEDCPERVAARRKKVENATWDSKVKIIMNELFGSNELVNGADNL